MSKSRDKIKEKQPVRMQGDDASEAAAEVVVHEYPSLVEWFKTVATNITSNWFIIGLTILTVFVAFFFYYPSVGGDEDIWFHIRYGAYFVQHHTWQLDHGQFSWTVFNPKFKYVTWIGSSIIYIVYAMMSHYGLYLLLYAVIGAIIYCFLLFLKRTGYRFDITSLLAIMGVLLVINLKYLYIKPDMFSGLFFVIACMIYYLAKENENWKLFYVYPILFLIWVNTHGGFIIGLFFVSAALAGETANAIFFRQARLKWKQLMHLAVSVLLSYAVLGINPEGYGYFIGIIRDLFSPEMKATKETILEYRSMWDTILFKPVGLRFKFAGYGMLVMLLSFVSICVYLLKKKGFFDLPSVFLVAFFYMFGMSLVRASQYFPLVWFFAFFYVYKRYDVIKIKGVINFISLAVIFMLSVRIVDFALVDYDSIAWFGTNWEESYPVKEVEYIKKAHPPGNIWNDYLSGGYMLWALYPGYKVFMDPRYGGYMTNFLPTAEEFSSPKGLDDYRKRFPFNTALVAYYNTDMIQWLLKADWRIAFLEKNGLVIVHKSVVPQLSKESLAVDVSAGRFVNVDNPSILKTLFNFYVHLGPEYGREILNIYQKNVRTIYRNRDADLAAMQNLLLAREVEMKKTQQAGKPKAGK
ncbi:MAG: hypothetical protein HQL08_06590 [Nitrospirae bacterium]|nr:hypothetical protein [Nitrospirota bacterium]